MQPGNNPPKNNGKSSWKPFQSRLKIFKRAKQTSQEIFGQFSGRFFRKKSLTIPLKPFQSRLKTFKRAKQTSQEIGPSRVWRTWRAFVRCCKQTGHGKATWQAPQKENRKGKRRRNHRSRRRENYKKKGKIRFSVFFFGFSLFFLGFSCFFLGFFTRVGFPKRPFKFPLPPKKNPTLNNFLCVDPRNKGTPAP